MTIPSPPSVDDLFSLSNLAKASIPAPPMPMFDLLPPPPPFVAATQSSAITSLPTGAKTPAAKISDLGEKIGGARKDTARRGMSRAKKQTDDASDEEKDKPTWARRFHIYQIAASLKQAEIGKWGIADRLKKSSRGELRVATRFTYETKEEAQRAVPQLALALNHRVSFTDASGQPVFRICKRISDRKSVRIVPTDFASNEDAMRYMAVNSEAILNTSTTFGEADLPVPKDYRRSGPVWRDTDARGEDFMRRFSLRGVEFGNWNNQDERKFILDVAYDGLMDLSDVLQLPPEKLGLFGELALAFGARGHGLSSARAHFEANKVAINITKMKGAGSLAHEWAHALDNLLAKLDGKAENSWSTDKDGTRSITIRHHNDSYLSHGRLHSGSKTSRALADVFFAIMRAMYKKPAAYVEDLERAQEFVDSSQARLQKELDSIRSSLAAVLTYGRRHTASALPEQLAEFDSLANALLDGTSGQLKLAYCDVDKKGKVSVRWTNPALDGIDVILKKVRNRSGFKADKTGVLDQLVHPFNSLEARRTKLASAQRGDENIQYVITDYAMAAIELDQGRGENYWQTETEMFARAFSSYVEDKLHAQGRISNYLNYASPHCLIATSWGSFAPFPLEAERATLTALFDRLFDVIRAEWCSPTPVALVEIEARAPTSELLPA